MIVWPHKDQTQLGIEFKQGMVDGSASKPALRQDTVYLVEKPYRDIAPYLELI